MKRILTLIAILTLLTVPLAHADLVTEGYPLVPETVVYTMLNPSNAGEKYENLNLFKQMELVTNVRFEFSNTSSVEYLTQQNMGLASGQIPDVLWNALDNSLVVTYGVEGGMLLDIAPYIDEYMPNLKKMLDKYPLARASVTESNGGIYVLPKVSMTATEGGEVLYVRTDYLEKVGKQKPTTIDEFYDCLVALKNADCFPEKFVPLLPQKMDILESYLFPSFGDSVDPLFGADADGNVVYNRISDQYKRYTEFMSKLFREGLLMNEIYSMDNSVIVSKVKANECAFFTHGTSLARSNFESGNYDVEIVTPMTSEYTSTPKVRGIMYVKVGGISISAKAQNPEILLKYFDIWYSEDDVVVPGLNGISTKFGIENVNWKYVDDSHEHYVRIVPDDTTLTAEEYRINFVAPSAQPPAYAIMTAVPSGDPAQEMKGSQYLVNYIPYWVTRFPMDFLRLTTEENEVIASLMVDIKTYSDNMIAKFITGAEPLEKWDEYVNQIKSMGIQDVLDVYQAAYSRLLAVSK